MLLIYCLITQEALVSKLAQVETSDLSNSIIRLQTDLNDHFRLADSVEKLKGKNWQ